MGSGHPQVALEDNAVHELARQYMIELVQQHRINNLPKTRAKYASAKRDEL